MSGKEEKMEYVEEEASASGRVKRATPSPSRAAQVVESSQHIDQEASPSTSKKGLVASVKGVFKRRSKSPSPSRATGFERRRSKSPSPSRLTFFIRKSRSPSPSKVTVPTEGDVDELPIIYSSGEESTSLSPVKTGEVDKYARTGARPKEPTPQKKEKEEGAKGSSLRYVVEKGKSLFGMDEASRQKKKKKAEEAEGQPRPKDMIRDYMECLLDKKEEDKEAEEDAKAPPTIMTDLPSSSPDVSMMDD